MGKTKDIPSLDEPEISRFLSLISEPLRARVMKHLATVDEASVTEMVEIVGATSQPGLSHHLSLFKMAGVLESRRENKYCYYKIVPSKVRRAIDALSQLVPAE